MTNRVTRWALAAVLMTATVGSVDLASADEASQRNDAKGRELFRLGEAHYAAGRYEKAVTFYEESFALSGRPEVLLAVVNAYERLNNYPRAIENLRKYLKHPQAENVPVLRDRLRRIEETDRAHREEQERVQRLEEAQRERDRERTKQRAEGRRPRESTTTFGAATPGDPDDAPSRAPAYVLYAVGAASLGSAAIFGVISHRAGSTAEAVCGESGLCEARGQKYLDRERKYAILTDVSVGVGLAAAVVGTYFLLRGGDEEMSAERQALRVEPTAFPGGLGVGLAGGF